MHLHDKHVLVVEDDEVIRGLLLEQLKEEGYRVYAASGAGEAMKMLRGFVPDLIISDIMMPHKDGYEFCREIRSLEALKAVPFMFVSARGEVSERLEGFRSGATDFLPKPFEMKEFLFRVNRQIESQRNRKADPSPEAAEVCWLCSGETVLKTLESLSVAEGVAVLWLSIQSTDSTQGWEPKTPPAVAWIREIDHQLRSVLRGTDWVYRMEPATWILIMRGMSPQTGGLVLKRIEESISTPLDYRNDIAFKKQVMAQPDAIEFLRRRYRSPA